MKKKHKITLLVIGILLALSLMLSSSYALWVFNVSQESTNVLVSDCFEITLTDNNPIGLSASFPMRDSDGVKTTPYTFTIRNICNHPADFQINLETLNTSTIDEEFIKADLNGHVTEYNVAESAEPTIEGAKNAVKLYEDTLAVNSSKTYNLRIWVNESATQDDVENKSYASKISVKATVRKQYAEGTLISGQQFNVALKKLADGGNPRYSSNNTSITSIEWSNTAPQENDNAVNLAVEGTTTPIYAWFKDGTIYINSEFDKIYMNQQTDYMFYSMKGVTLLDLSHFDTSKTLNMSYMFYYVSNLTSLDVSRFDTSNVTSMSSMFNGMSSLTSLDVSRFDTSKVTSMSSMFYGMGSLTNLDVSHFDTSKVTNMSYMFDGMSNLTSLDVSHFDTSKVTNMSYMFEGMRGLTSLDLSNFDTSKVIEMSNMFWDDRSLASLNVSGFDTQNVTKMSYMFYGMGSLTSLDVSHFDTSKVTTMSGMFNGLKNMTSLDVSNFDTSNVTIMSGMFSGMINLTSLDVSHFDTSKVTSMYSMFSGSGTSIEQQMKLQHIYGLENFDTSSVTNMSRMFSYCGFLKELNISNFDTSNVTDMSGMFSGWHNNVGFITTLDLSNFNTSNVTNMSSMFAWSDKLENIIFGSNFDTSKVIDMRCMFEYMGSLTIIYVGNNWNVSNVISSNDMFHGDNNLIGGAGTTFDSNHTNTEYARVDDPANGKPGYFTYKSA